MEDHIVVLGAHENNLQHVDVRIPKGKLVVFTGVSGSGKSSLVFDTIAVESMRQWTENFPLHVRNRLAHHVRPHVDHIDNLTPAIVIDQRPHPGNTRSTVGTMTDISPLVRLLYSRCATPSAGSSGAYSFNDPAGMCPGCSGLGREVSFDLDKVLDTTRSINEGAIRLPGHQPGTYQWMLYANSGLFDPDKPVDDFTDTEWRDLLHGSGINVSIDATKGRGVWTTYELSYEGLQDRIDRLYLRRDAGTLTKAGRRLISDFTVQSVCPGCRGHRLNRASLASRLNGLNIAELGDLEIGELVRFMERIDDPVGRALADDIRRRLSSVASLGLDYLNLNRVSSSLSGGESRRLRLVRHLGSSLVGLTYVLDEPSVGLHPQDVDRLVSLLRSLRGRGNSVLVVEHDREIIRVADEIIELGPAAGRQGGQIVFQGSYEDLLAKDTPTAVTARSARRTPRPPRQAQGVIAVESAALHNLRQVSVEIPRGVLTAVTGVAGSGKSSLVCGELLRQHSGVIHVSQSPIGTTSRSTPATHVGVMDDIRRMFAKANGVDAAMFSSNSRGGCPTCKGKGVLQTEMAFSDPVTITCEDCAGSRYRATVLQHLLRGLSILEVLQLTVDDASHFFTESRLLAKLAALQEVGMGYLTLGQPTNSLSGGESQRLKLASSLTARGEVYALDEPTSGLHPSDVEMLMRILDRLVDQGNTVIVVEHERDVILRADWVIDLGPGGGKHGGRVMFEGTPADLMREGTSATATYLRRQRDEHTGGAQLPWDAEIDTKSSTETA